MIMEWYYNIILVLATIVVGTSVVAIVVNNKYNRKSR